MYTQLTNFILKHILNITYNNASTPVGNMIMKCSMKYQLFNPNIYHIETKKQEVKTLKTTAVQVSIQQS